jgi:hypothetical protein
MEVKCVLVLWNVPEGAKLTLYQCVTHSSSGASVVKDQEERNTRSGVGGNGARP